MINNEYILIFVCAFGSNLCIIILERKNTTLRFILWLHRSTVSERSHTLLGHSVDFNSRVIFVAQYAHDVWQQIQLSSVAKLISYEASKCYAFSMKVS